MTDLSVGGGFRKQFHLLLAGATLVLTLALLWGLYDATGSMRRLSGGFFHSSNLHGLMLSCRVHEENFLAEKTLNHVDAFISSYDALHNSLSKLSESGGIIAADATRTAKEAARRYRRLFNDIVDREKLIGLTEDQGLRGRLRRAIHYVEKNIQGQRHTSLMDRMLMCRRHEKDFIIRGKSEYMVKFEKAFDEFRQHLAKSAIEETLRERLTVMADIYSIEFHNLVDAWGAVGATPHTGLRGEMDLAAKDLESAMDTIRENARRQYGQILNYLKRFIALFLVISLLALTLLGRLLQFNRRLREESLERLEAQEALRRANETLELRVQKRTEEIAMRIGELTQHNQEIALINELNDTLHACRSVTETFPVIASYAASLFPLDAGAVYLFDNERANLESVAPWGAPGEIAQIIGFGDCWGLRKGKPHIVEGHDASPGCRHMGDEPSGIAFCYICAPMISQGEVIGLLHLQCGQRQCETGGGKGCIDTAKQNLVIALAENLALALANMQLRESLREQSIRDPLTGLYNRRYLDETLERESVRTERAETQMAVVMIDIDHFKAFNDRMGHDAGDAVLAKVASLLENSVRGGDIVCRFGGEEFTVIMPGISLEKAMERAESLREAVAATEMVHQGTPLGSVNISLGVAMFPVHSRRIAQVLEHADAALYRAKAKGRNRVVAYEEKVTPP